jgi:hypothetical protein
MTTTDKRPVLVTTAHRGVFFGYVSDADETTHTDRTLDLADARMAIRWGTTGGVLELAATGPTSASKIGATAPLIRLHDVTSVSAVTPAAEAAWRTA